MTSKQVWMLALFLPLLAVTLGCGSGSSNLTVPPQAKPDFLYAITVSGPPNTPAFNLASFRVDPSTGAVSSTSTTPLSTLTLGLAVDPAAKSLYVSSPNPLGNAISIFAIDPTNGVPTPTSAFSVTAICAFCPPQSGPGSLALDPNGKFLFYGSSTLGLTVAEGVGVLGVDSTTGALSSVSGSPFLVTQAPFLLTVDPSGQFLYTEDIDKTGANFIVLQSVSGFSVDPNTGALTPVPGSPFNPPLNANVAGFAVHPSGKFLYASTGLAANGILAWNVDSVTGALASLPGSPFQSGVATFGAVFDPLGKFLYVSAGAPGGILGFSVDANSGALTPLPGSPFSSGSVLTGFAVDPSGRFLFAVDIKNSAIAGFSLDATTGTLTALGTPTPTSARPAFMTIIKAP